MKTIKMPYNHNMLFQGKRDFGYSMPLFTFLIVAAALSCTAQEPATRVKADSLIYPPSVIINNTPQTILADPRVHLEFEKEQLVLDDALQPSMVITKKGTIVVQASVQHQPVFPSKRIFSHFPRGTVVSRDGARTWKTIPLTPGENGLFMESDAVQLNDGTIFAMDTYVTPGKKPDEGLGLLYYSTDDWKTLKGPEEISFHLPGVNFYASSDDGGNPHVAVRLHRTILELPNGDLLATMYGWWKGDTASASYQATAKKTRCVLVRSTNRGRHWEQVSIIANDLSVGTEGFNEPTIVRINTAPHAGRLICFMRTGQELNEAISDDEGRTWTKARPRIFADLDVRRTDLWIDLYRSIRDKDGKPLPEVDYQLVGAVVDPHLIQLRSGVLAVAFGMRVPPRANWRNPKHPWNGNYLAFSLDHGDTWSNVVRLTSGVPTTHYMAVQEMPKDNQLFVVYDHGNFSKDRVHYIYGRVLRLRVDKK